MTFQRHCCGFALLALTIGITAGPAKARTAPRFLALGAPADAPAGFLDMCARDATLCGTNHKSQSAPGSAVRWATGGIAPVDRTKTDVASPDIGAAAERRQRHDLLSSVNDRVNRTIVQRSDMQIYGVGEWWARPGREPGAMGDCEDIAIEKRMRLIAAGFPEQNLFYAVVYSHSFGLHTLLIARTPDGDEVLDSLTDRIVPWSQTSYNWIRIQTPGEPMNWRRPGHPS